MKAIRVDRYGTPDVLCLKEVELPEPKPGEVRVHLQAAGLKFVDIYITHTGTANSPSATRRPFPLRGVTLRQGPIDLG